MKQLFLGLLVFIVLGSAGYMGYTYLSQQKQTPRNSAPSAGESKTDTASGLLMPGKGDDYSYILLAEGGKTIGIAAQSIDLSQYVNKKVVITGSYSGTTLYAYTVTEQ